MLLPLPPGSPFPLISTTHTDVWLEFWNIQWKSWIEGILNSGVGPAGGWPSSLTGNGRVQETDPAEFLPDTPASPSLALILPEGLKLVVGGQYVVLDEDVTIGEISPDFEGWIVPTRTYDDDAEYYVWSHEEYPTSGPRPDLGYGVLAKIVSINDRVSEISTAESDTDVILSLPLIYERLRNLASSGGGGGSGTVYLEDQLYTRADPRNAVVVIEEKIAEVLSTVRDIIEAGGDKESQSDINQTLELCLGLVRGMMEVAPQTLRFVNVGAARPGIYGTASAPDTELFDRGGTIPEKTDQRNWDSS